MEKEKAFLARDCLVPPLLSCHYIPGRSITLRCVEERLRTRASVHPTEWCLSAPVAELGTERSRLTRHM